MESLTIQTVAMMSMLQTALGLEAEENNKATGTKISCGLIVLTSEVERRLILAGDTFDEVRRAGSEMAGVAMLLHDALGRAASCLTLLAQSLSEILSGEQARTCPLGEGHKSLAGALADRLLAVQKEIKPLLEEKVA